MTSALRDAGVGVDGGYPVDRGHPADSEPNVSIHRRASPSPGRSESVVLGPANATNKPDESAIHPMKENQQ
jgi:hypothetical protein